MNKTLPQLKSKWHKEKEFYKINEVGTGVQSFVKDFLESKDILNLREGRLSTDVNSRKNEFIHEKRAKEQRRADFVIYINPEIVIPTEAECFENIKAGEIQLLNYQKDFDKKYGILTDGYTWRFYNNAFIVRSFNFDEIVERSDLFLDFWKEYIKPEFYYLSFFEKVGQLSLVENIFQVEKYRQLFFEDITNFIRSFKNKLQLEGYLSETENKTKEQKAIELTYAYIIQFILYKTLVDNDFDEFPKEFENFISKIHEYLKQKRYKDILGIINGISAKISKNIYRPFAEEQKFIQEKISTLFHSAENKLSDVSPWLDIFVFIKRYNFSNVKNEIFGYIYENYLKELYGEGKKGQYFTDPAVVNFMLQEIGYTPKNINKQYETDINSVSIIDPACGSGTFLYSATDAVIKAFNNDNEVTSKKIEEIVTNNIFGLDIEEFPLYLAEMSILMRLLPLIINEKYNNPIDKKIKVFKTRDSIAEFMNTALRNTINDIDVISQKRAGQMGLFDRNLNLGYESYVRDKDDLDEMKKSLENQLKNQKDIIRYRFDYVIANPPYISYNECSKQGVLIVKWIQEKKAQMSNIYGVNLNTVPGRIKAYAPKPNLYSFFIALGLGLLKDNGKLCFIIPQTLLTAGDLDVLRYHLAKFTTIEKIITFTNALFIGRGLKQKNRVATSSLILIVRRIRPTDSNLVKIINYKGTDEEIEKIFGNIIAGKKTDEKNIKQHDLLVNIANWNFIKQDKITLDFIKLYNQNDSFDLYRLEDAKTKFGSIFYFDKGLVFPKNKISQQSNLSDKNYFNLPSFRKNCFVVTNSNLIIHTKDIRFPKGSQGLDVYNMRYKIVWRYINSDKFYFSDKKIMISFNYVLISSNNKNEILYIFSLLNSAVNKFIFNRLLKNENEKDLLIGIKSIKEFIHVPKINKDNQFIKDVIIEKTEELLMLEEKKLSDFVDFAKILVQKFDSLSIEAKNLVVKKNQQLFKLPIKGNFNLVKKTIEKEYLKDSSLIEEGQQISLSQLKNSPVIDFEQQKILKDYIDDLVFCLYFNLQIPKDKLSNTKFIKQHCRANKFYKELTDN